MKYYLPLFLLTASAFAEYRDITSSSGQIISARILSLDSGIVKLERADRRIFTIPLSSLSSAEIERIRTEFSENTDKEEDVVKSDIELIRAKLSSKYPIDVKMSKSEASEAFRQALNYQQSKDFEKAIKKWASIPENRDEYADSRRRAGYNILGRELGRWDEAIVFLLDAYAEAPKDRNTLEDLGRAYMRIDDFENAKLYLHKAKTKNAREALQEIKEMGV